MPTGKYFSDLTNLAPASVAANNILAIQTDPHGSAGYKITADNAGIYFNTIETYTGLDTNDKTIVGALNEAYQFDRVLISGSDYRIVPRHTADVVNLPTTTASSLIGVDANKDIVTITVLPDGTTATTQTAGDNSTKVATTAYVENAVSGENLWDRVDMGGGDYYLQPNTTTDGLFIGDIAGDGLDYKGSILELGNAVNNTGLFLRTGGTADFLYQGGTETENSHALLLENMSNGTSMIATENGLLFRQAYYDVSSPLAVDEGFVGFGTQSNWTSDPATQNSYFIARACSLGSLTDVMMIGPDGGVMLPVFVGSPGFILSDNSGILYSAGLTLPNGTTATTQTAGDNSTKVATTAYVENAVSGENLWDRVAAGSGFYHLYPHNSGTDIVKVTVFGNQSTPNYNLISEQSFNGPSMENTGNGILFTQYYSDSVTPATEGSVEGYLGFFTETNWSADISSRNSNFKLQVVALGSFVDVIKINSNATALAYGIWSYNSAPTFTPGSNQLATVKYVDDSSLWSRLYQGGVYFVRPDTVTDSIATSGGVCVGVPYESTDGSWLQSKTGSVLATTYKLSHYEDVSGDGSAYGYVDKFTVDYLGNAIIYSSSPNLGTLSVKNTFFKETSDTISPATGYAAISVSNTGGINFSSNHSGSVTIPLYYTLGEGLYTTSSFISLGGGYFQGAINVDGCWASSINSNDWVYSRREGGSFIEKARLSSVGKFSCASGISIPGSMVVGLTSGFYISDTDGGTDGDLRIVASGASAALQKRVSGSWTNVTWQ